MSVIPTLGFFYPAKLCRDSGPGSPKIASEFCTHARTLSLNGLQDKTNRDYSHPSGMLGMLFLL